MTDLCIKYETPCFLSARRLEVTLTFHRSSVKRRVTQRSSESVTKLQTNFRKTHFLLVSISLLLFYCLPRARYEAVKHVKLHRFAGESAKIKI